MLVVDDSFFSCGMLDFVFDLIGSNGSNAQQRVLEVRADLAGYLSMSSLHLAAKSSRDIAVTGRDAILGVLLGEHDRRSAHAGTAQRRDVANQSALAVGVPLAHFAVLAPQREHTVADDSVNVHTNQPGAAVFVGVARPSVADILAVDALVLLLFV